MIGKKFSHDINCLPKTLKFLEIKSKYYSDYNYINNYLNICSLPKNLEAITIVNKSYQTGNYKQIEKYNIDNIKYKFGKEKIFLY